MVKKIILPFWKTTRLGSDGL